MWFYFWTYLVLLTSLLLFYFLFHWKWVALSLAIFSNFFSAVLTFYFDIYFSNPVQESLWFFNLMIHIFHWFWKLFITVSLNITTSKFSLLSPYNSCYIDYKLLSLSSISFNPPINIFYIFPCILGIYDLTVSHFFL